MAAPGRRPEPGPLSRARDLPVAQRVVDVLDLSAGCRDRADVLAAAIGDPILSGPTPVCGPSRLTDSIAAHRTSLEPCLVIRPRRTWVSDSWCLGVSPAHEARCAADR